ncbi:hypothetical protein KGQ71_04060, partial [Patescibacteria group bacterium]|nr:hypothetical protein [Patescibacteria group bacterium]
ILPGFVIGKQFYADFFTSDKVEGRIKAAAKGLSIKNPHHFAGVAKDIRTIIRKAPFSAEMKQSLAAYLADLKKWTVSKPEAGMRLRISTGPDSVSASHLVHTDADLEHEIKFTLSLLFAEDELFQRLVTRKTVVPPAVALLVQIEEPTEYSGTAVCHDTANHDDETIEIKAVHNQETKLGELNLWDTYRVDRKSLSLLSRGVKRQWWSLDSAGSFLSPTQLGKSEQTLSDTQIVQLARQIRTAQAGFQDPRLFSWVYGHGRFWISRVVGLNGCECQADGPAVTSASLTKPLLAGISGSLGWVSGPARLIKKKADREKVKDREIIVIEQVTDADYEWLAGAAGLVTEVGHRSGEEAKLAKQMGIPAVVGTGIALSHLQDGQVITVDGYSGAIYPGFQIQPRQPAQELPYRLPVPPTGTKIYATVTDPQAISSADLELCDGIGLLRGEHILRMLGMHPRDIVDRQLAAEYSEVLSESIARILVAVYPRPVIYQLHDLVSMELAGFPGRRHRPEPNPALGYRGTYRLLAEPELLDLELNALTRLAEQGLTNFSVMLPMARSLAEVKRAGELIAESALARVYRPGLWIKCETPALLILMDELCEMEVDGVCFDIPSLSQFILGIDKTNHQMAHHLNPAEPAVRQALEFAIATCRKHGVPTTVSAESEELRPEVVQAAVEAGVTAISVVPGLLAETHGLVAAVERRMGQEILRQET